MDTIEFRTRSKNGIIKIPERYKELNSEDIRVIIIRDKDISGKDKLNKFLKFAKGMKLTLPKNYRFDREKLYER